MTELFRTDLARAAGAWVHARIQAFEEFDEFTYSAEPGTAHFSPEYAVLQRIAGFRYADYPDYTVPWHLIRWPHMRWEHVFYVLSIIESLKQAKGASVGKSIHLEPFQVLIILCFLGPEDPKTHLRLVREGLLTISRKNGKTTLIAGIVTALMILDEQQHGLKGQEIYVGASDRKQAGITYDIVAKFILQDRELGISDLFRMVPSRKHMTHLQTLTEFEVLSSDAYRAHGLNPAVIIFDETGNIPQQSADEFYGVLTSGFGAQREPLTLLLSTQAPTDTHLFSQMVDRCKRINAGEEAGDDTAGFVFETPETVGNEKLDPHDERWWYLSNPGLGVAPSMEDMCTESTKAKALPSLEAKFRNLRLNQRSNPYNPLLSKSVWARNGGPIDYERLYGRKCWGGLDLSLVRDLTALVFVFEPDDEGGAMPVLPYFWLPSAGLEEKQFIDKVPYVLWAQQGFLDISSHSTIDFELVASQIQVCMSDFSVQGIAYDRWKSDTIKAKLRDLGLGDVVDDEAFFRPLGQGFRDASPCVDVLEKTVIEGRLAHANHPVLTWNASNTVTVSDPAGNRKVDKARSYGRIDGVVSLMMALRLIELQALTDTAPSAFETELCLM
jgi:phage terminase large subunit-like protein